MNNISAILEGLNQNKLNESAKTATSIDKWDKSITYDGKDFYFNDVKINKPELAEEALRYFSFKGIHFKRSSNLTKEDLDKFFAQLWKAIPNKYHITLFGERGVVRYAVKNGSKIDITNYKNEIDSFDGEWYLKNCAQHGENLILSKEKAPNNIRYDDISNDFGKTHNFKSSDIKIKGGKKIEFEDDLVVVYDKYGNVIYKGIEDDEPMKKENWKWDNSKKYYIFKDYIKVGM